MLKRAIMVRVPFFANFEVDLFIQLVQALQPVTFLPGEYVIEKGELGDGMFFIDRGKVDVLIPQPHLKDRLVCTLKTGQFFCERALLDTECPASCSIR